MTSSITTAKQQLRAVVKQRLSTIPQESILTQSRRVFEVLRDFKPYREASRISVFLSMPSGEIQTDAIVRHALSEGKQVFVPFLHRNPQPTPGTPARVMDMVRLRSVEDYDSLQRDAWGIPSIDAGGVRERERVLGQDLGQESGAGPEPLDLVLVPGVAFDVDGLGAVRRLGHGKGFYDFFLNRYLAATGHGARPLLYGLALREQLLDGAVGEEVPMGMYDRKVHGVVLGDGGVRESADPGAISAWHPS
ncbi:putative 5-formyltetrahydrofolate cyclo-ligase [Escovopsis weberi]|uniref:5-formyltetrahydrofolate cyclo-ligase n=1 Tax=Escovopsis weberi TaxID=150374 RepID=A0A0M9VSL6_ESCWE|nr:putative 5-formyltetrahydrofolate cyclo-ligase [Escovopsis weberi]